MRNTPHMLELAGEAGSLRLTYAARDALKDERLR